MASLETILSKLDGDEGEAVLQHWRRHDKIAMRNREIYAVSRDFFADRSLRGTAREIERQLNTLQGLRNLPLEDSTLHGRLVSVLRLNGGRSLGRGQIGNIIALWR